MIVVVGQPYLREAVQGLALDGLAARIAIAAADRGHAAQLVGAAGDDSAGDEVVLALARAGVGHLALLRKAGQRVLTLRAEDPDAEHPGDEGIEGDEGTHQVDTVTQLDASDVDLALRYLTDFSVLVLAAPTDEAVARVVSAAAGWADARLIVIVPHGLAIPDGLPPDAIVFGGPDADPDGVFADMVGGFAAALDDGDEPGMAFRATVESAGWAPAEAEQA